MPPSTAHIHAIGTAVPSHDIHRAFVDWAAARLEAPGGIGAGDRRAAALFRRMDQRAGIAARWSVLPPTPTGGSPVADGGFYAVDPLPPTSARMAIYADAAPPLALAAIAALAGQTPLGTITHLVVASCTGFMAPGLDQILADRLGLDPAVERTLVGFMGCYAAIVALRTAHHIVRSEPAARVLVVTVELSTLHLQPAGELEPLLAMLQFGDGAAAALVTAKPGGFAIERPFAATLPDTAHLIRWAIGDTGFAMHLSGEVPGHIGRALTDPAFRDRLFPDGVAAIDAWAVHAGGRSILDAVEGALGLDPNALDASRSVLKRYGNMSSATLMFVLADLLDRPDARNGLAVAFGPGLAADGFRFHRA
ncbi:type III polyketide synthase [Sphingomonas arantia]|uniref:Type III polyketide synthase n=1 Tax=Sphingomonas arantia TaxID=1460676 RepID=A0ABW4TTM6_9SPHN